MQRILGSGRCSWARKSLTSLLQCRLGRLFCAVATFSLWGCGAGTIPNDEECTKTRCAELGKNCGEIVVDGCGAVQCGVCEDPEKCGGSGTPNVCGVGECEPNWECEQPLNGNERDGCGKSRPNPACDAPSPCGNGVTDPGEACDTNGNVGCGEPTPFCQDGCQTCVAASIVINPDKTISINGKKTFPVTMEGMCNSGFEAPGECELKMNSDVFHLDSGDPLGNFDTYGYQQMFEDERVFFTLYAPNFSQYPVDLINSSYHWLYQTINEPSDGTEEWPPHTNSADCTSRRYYLDAVWKDNKCYFPNLTTLVQNAYKNVKAVDTGHPILLSNWRQMARWVPYADILANAIYPIRDSTQDYTREEAVIFRYHDPRCFSLSWTQGPEAQFTVYQS